MMSLLKRTKIICTIGPATNTKEKMLDLVAAGMNVCRLNFSHGTHEDHAAMIKLIREVAEETGEPLCILQDLQGPKIRVGELPEEGVMLKEAAQIIFTTGTADIPNKLPVTYPKLHEDVRPGQKLLLDDGLLSVEVVKIDGQDVICKVINGGKLTSHKGLNLPETKTSIPALTDKDRDDVKFGIEHDVDWIALSFVRKPEDLKDLRDLVSKTSIKIMAKIEKPEAIDNFDAILRVVDGIMVARGDLGIEMAPEKVPVLQKMMIAKCLEVAKPVVVATQMLDSMIRNPRATRAEISDVANAVIDHCDATMLSGETASGAYPIEAVKTMTATIIETEKSEYDDQPIHIRLQETPKQAMTNIAAILARSHKTKAMVVASLSGETARLVSRYRPELPLFVFTTDLRIARQSNIIWAARPMLAPTCKTVSELIDQAITSLKQKKYITDGDEIILVAGEPVAETGMVNLVELRTV